MEIVLTPLLFGGLGWWIDGWLGTDPFLAVLFGVLGVTGIFVKLKLGYDQQMTKVEAGKPWTRRPGGPEATQ
jgi:hypothetical protein